MSLPSFVQEGGRAGGALVVVGQPLPGGTAPWGGLGQLPAQFAGGQPHTGVSPSTEAWCVGCPRCCLPGPHVEALQTGLGFCKASLPPQPRCGLLPPRGPGPAAPRQAAWQPGAWLQNIKVN